MKENKIKCENILKNCVFIYEWNGKNKLEQYYQIDFNKPVKIGGLSQDGYMLKLFKDGSETGMCITYLNALKLAHGDILKINGAKVSFLNRN